MLEAEHAPAPAHEIRDCNYGGQRLGRKRSCRMIREFAAHNRRWGTSNGNEASRLAELFNCSIWQFAPGCCRYRKYTRAIVASFQLWIPKNAISITSIASIADKIENDIGNFLL